MLPSLRFAVELRNNRSRVLQYIRVSVFPELLHRYNVRRMSMYVARRLVPENLRPPRLVRQVAGELRCYSTNPRDSQILSSHGELSESDDVVGREVGSVRGCRYLGTNMFRSSRGVDLGGGGGRGVRPWELALANSAPVSLGSGGASVESPPVEEESHLEYVVVRRGVPFAYGPNGYMSIVEGDTRYVVRPASDRWREGFSTRRTRNLVAELGIGIAHTESINELAEFELLVDQDGLHCRSFILEHEVVPGYVNYGGVYRHGGRIPYGEWGREALFPFSRLDGFEELWVYHPCVRMLMRKYGACLPEESVLRSALNDVERQYATLPIDIKEACIYLLRERLEKHSQVLKGSKPRATAPIFVSQQYTQQFRDHGIMVKYGLYKLQYECCDLRPDRDRMYRRDLLDVKEEIGGSFVDGQLVWDDPDTRPLKEVLMACTFQGLRNFIYYERNHSNQAAALIRLFKCRGGNRFTDKEFARLQNTFVFDVFRPNHDWFSKLGRFVLAYDNQPQVVVPRVLDDVVGRFNCLVMCMNDRTGGQGNQNRHYFRMDDPRHLEIHGWFIPLFAEYRKSEGFLAYIRMCAIIFVGQYVMLAARLCGYVGFQVVRALCSAMLAVMSLIDLALFRLVHSHINHAKRQMRQSVGRMQYGLHRPVAAGFMPKRMCFEVKDEPAKPGLMPGQQKPPRGYFSLGVMSSLFGGAWVDVAKKKLYAERCVYLEGWKLRTQFLSRNSYEDVSQIFNIMFESHVSGRNEIYATFMSDDVGVSTPDGFYNLDISMCDSSLGPGVFWLLVLFLRSAWVPEPIIEGLLDQLSREVEILNPITKRFKIIFQFLTYYLVSGTVLTTITDSLASLIVICAFTAAYCFGVREPEAFSLYFRAVGLVVTVDKCESFLDFSMLKRRPVRLLNSSAWGAPLALGCLFKRFGVIDVPFCKLNECVPAKCVTLEDKSRAFLGAIVEGWKSEPKHLLLKVFKERFPHVGAKLPLLDERFDDKDNYDEVDVESILECYHVSRCEYDEAVTHASQLDVGYLSHTSFMTAVMSKDYGL